MKATHRFQPFSALGAAVFSACLCLGLSPAASAALIVQYTFDGDTGSTAVNSGTAGTGANATITGGSFTTDAQRGDVLSMNGNGSYGSVTFSITTGSYTFAGWYKGSDASGAWYDQGASPRAIPSLGYGTVSDPDDGGTSNYGLGFYDGSQWYNSGATTSTWTDGEWHHIAWVFEADGLGAGTDSMTIYLDGVAQDVNLGTAGIQTKRAVAIPDLGGDTQRLLARYTAPTGSNSGDQLGGLIDDYQIYDTALSASEITALVPESSAVLLGLGGLALLVRRRRR